MNPALVKSKVKTKIKMLLLEWHTELKHQLIVSLETLNPDIEPIYRKINSENKNIFIMGDFNIY